MGAEYQLNQCGQCQQYQQCLQMIFDISFNPCNQRSLVMCFDYRIGNFPPKEIPHMTR